MLLKRVLAHAGYFLAAGALAGLIVGLAPPAEAYTYNGQAAANYAHKWSANGKKTRNAKFDAFSNDCANFVSQSLRAGGWTMDSSGPHEWWYDWNSALPDLQSRSWINALGLAQYARAQSGRSDGFKSLTMNSAYTPASAGDIYLYEWGDDDGFDHVSLASGWGGFADYYDRDRRKQYLAVTHGKGDYMSQHTTDRDYAPWNWGYWTESNPSRRRKMMTAWIGIH